MRRLCNLVYAWLAEGLTAGDAESFDKLDEILEEPFEDELAARRRTRTSPGRPPSRRAPERNQNLQGVIAAFGLPAAGSR